LVARDGIALAVENEEARRRGALVDAADEPVLRLAVVRLEDAVREVVLVARVQVGRVVRESPGRGGSGLHQQAVEVEAGAAVEECVLKQGWIEFGDVYHGGVLVLCSRGCVCMY
jgi:hypothetical protein